MAKILPKEKRSAFDGLGNPVELQSLPHDVVEALGCSAGPVRLLTGFEGRHGGYGYEHLIAKANRSSQIKTSGFKSIHSYIRSILNHYSHAGIQADGRLLLIAERVLNQSTVYDWLICQWDAELAIWSVTTAIPKRTIRNAKIDWEKK